MKTDKSLFAIYGASGYGREVMPVARQSASRLSANAELVFVDDAGGNRVINGHEVLTFDQFLARDAAAKAVSVAVADSRVREELVNRCAAQGLTFFNAIADGVVIMDDVTIGEGCILNPFVTFTSNIKVGRHFHANLYSYVAHDCVIGDFVTFAPAVKCNGNVVVEDHAYIGTGAVLRQGSAGSPLVIGRGAIVGMGAVVTKSVPAGVTVVGNPARVLESSKSKC